MFCIIAQQALPLRGNWNSEHGVEEKRNNPRIFNWLTQKTKYTSPEIQNELLQVKL